MNFSILTSTKVWGIKYKVLISLDSEFERILRIGPSWGQLGVGGGKNELLYFDLYQSVGYQI